MRNCFRCVSFLLLLGAAAKADPTGEAGRNLLYNGDFAKGAAMRAFLFPDAAEGPLVTLNASTPAEGLTAARSA